MLQKLLTLIRQGEKLDCIRFSKLDCVLQIPVITDAYLIELFDFGAYRLPCGSCSMDCDNCEYSSEEIEEDENYYWRHEKEIDVIKEIEEFLTNVMKMEYISNNYCIIGNTAFCFAYYVE